LSTEAFNYEIREISVEKLSIKRKG